MREEHQEFKQQADREIETAHAEVKELKVRISITDLSSKQPDF